MGRVNGVGGDLPILPRGETSAKPRRGRRVSKNAPSITIADQFDNCGISPAAGLVGSSVHRSRLRGGERYAEEKPQLVEVVVRHRVVHRAAVVPHDEISNRPPVAVDELVANGVFV